jgi:hypothetical protein
MKKIQLYQIYHTMTLSLMTNRLGMRKIPTRQGIRYLSRQFKLNQFSIAPWNISKDNDLSAYRIAAGRGILTSNDSASVLPVATDLSTYLYNQRVLPRLIMEHEQDRFNHMVRRAYQVAWGVHHGESHWTSVTAYEEEASSIMRMAALVCGALLPRHIVLYVSTREEEPETRLGSCYDGVCVEQAFRSVAGNNTPLAIAWQNLRADASMDEIAYVAGMYKISLSLYVDESSV